MTTTRQVAESAKRDHARRDAARKAAWDLHHRIASAVRADYPDLHHWALRVPDHRIVRTGPLEDDWRWGAYRSAADHARAYERYSARAVQVAASRICVAYGTGAGTEWAQKHFGCHGDETRAAEQVLASIAATRVSVR